MLPSGKVVPSLGATVVPAGAVAALPSLVDDTPLARSAFVVGCPSSLLIVPPFAVYVSV